jgi:leucyl/phenylalanyl-tRNA--protein transferase
MRQGARPRRFSPQAPDRSLGFGRFLPAFTVDDMIEAYRNGVFPNSDPYDDRYLTLANPARRAIVPIDGFHVPVNLARKVRNTTFDVRFDHDFPRLLDLCAEPAPDRSTTWLGQPMRRIYHELFARGVAHSVEVWDGDQMVGGSLCAAIGGVLFIDSGVSRARDASKISMVHAMARIARGGFQLVDCQILTPHMRQFGAIEISRAEYRSTLAAAIDLPRDFAATPPMSGLEALDALKAAARKEGADEAA